MNGILIFLTDPRNLLSMGVGIAVFATVLTLLSTLMGQADLNKRMKSVSERRDELRGHETWHQPVCQAAPRPVMRAAAGFHRDDGARWLLGQPLRERRATQLPALHDTAGLVEPAGGKGRLRQIDADGYSGHGDLPSRVPMVEHHHGPRGRAVVRKSGGSPFYSFKPTPLRGPA